MTSITLTRFNVNPRSYEFQDAYKACLNPDQDGNCPGIAVYMDGLQRLMRHYDDEPRAWSFSTWKRGNNTAKNWVSASAVVLEYRARESAQALALNLHERADSLGYAHLLLDSLSRKGQPTVTIVFPLTQAIDAKQYARLAAVLMEEMNVYCAASGNMAATHLIHREDTSDHLVFDGAVIAPVAKIRETADLYQNMDCTRFEAASPSAALHLADPVCTHDGLFEWSAHDSTALNLTDQISRLNC